MYAVSSAPCRSLYNRIRAVLRLNNYRDAQMDRDTALAGRSKTVVAINLATVLERSSEQILPSVYSYVARSFGSSPSHLGFLTLARSLAQAVFSPLGGLAGVLSRFSLKSFSFLYNL